MNKTKTRQIDSFKAISESGEIVTISIDQIFTLVEEFGKPTATEVPTGKKIRCSVGMGLNQLDDERYEIFTNKGNLIATRIR